MSWLFSRSACAYVSPTWGAMSFARNLWQQRTESLSQTLQGIAQVLAHARNKPNRLTVYVGAATLRASVIGAECGARSLAEYQALAEQQFARQTAHEERAQEQRWITECAVIAPHLGALAVALPQALLEDLRQLAATTGIARLSVQPAFLAPVHAAARMAPPTWAIVMAEPGALVTLQTMAAVTSTSAPAAPTLALGIQANHDEATALVREQARARFAGGPKCTLHTWQLQVARPNGEDEALAVGGLYFVRQDRSSPSESAA